MKESKIQIIVADDHIYVREGIRTLIEEIEGIEIVGEAANAIEAFNLVKTLKPDILISDIRMSPEMNGIDLAKKISASFPSTKVLLFSMHNDYNSIVRAYAAGAMGYIPKDSDDEQIKTAMESILAGRRYIPAEISQILAEEMLASPDDSFNEEPLTKREKEILQYLVEGMSNKQIAYQLYLSPRTVDTHRNNLMKKLQVKNVAELVRMYLTNTKRFTSLVAVAYIMGNFFSF
ncbi:MAG: response regulator [Bacteroidota bacterium]